jgi:hypothetical protein
VGPLSVLGANSQVIYGANFQVATPLNFQMTVGGNIQIVVNPLAFEAAFHGDPGTGKLMPSEPQLAQLLGSGLGGNMQLTLGSNATFVMGQTFDINLGPRRVQIDSHNKTSSKPAIFQLGIVIQVVAIVFLLTYALVQSDDARAVLLILFEIVMEVMLMALMDFESLYNFEDDKMKREYNMMWKAGWKEKGMKDDELEKLTTAFWSKASGLEGMGTIVGTMVLPLLFEAAGEGKLDVSPN